LDPGLTSAHEPSINAAACSANIGSLHIDLHGGASWLYDLFTGIIEDAVKKELNSQMCGIIVSEVHLKHSARKPAF
jgi:lipopolysaccharide-binding protein